MGEYWIPRIIYSTSNPTVNADESKGIIVGQTWKNTTTGERFECIGNSTGIARWYKIIDYLDPNETTVPDFQEEIETVVNRGNVLITPEVIYMSGLIDYPLSIPEAANAMSIGPIVISDNITVDGEWVIL